MGHAWGHGLPDVIQLYSAMQHTAIYSYTSLITLYTLYITPLS